MREREKGKEYICLGGCFPRRWTTSRWGDDDDGGGNVFWDGVVVLLQRLFRCALGRRKIPRGETRRDGVETVVPVYFDYRRHVKLECGERREREREEEDGGRALTPASVEELERESRQELWTDVAVRLRDLARDNGGIYVKAGQHLCVQPVAPAPFREMLRVLMDDASSRPFEEDEKTFSEEFNGLKPKDVFLEFDEKPIASASLAQVYKAKTRWAKTWR